MPSTLRRKMGDKKSWKNLCLCYMSLLFLFEFAHCLHKVYIWSWKDVRIFHPNTFIIYFFNSGTEFIVCGNFNVDCFSEGPQDTTNFWITNFNLRPTVNFLRIQNNLSMVVHIYIYLLIAKSLLYEMSKKQCVRSWCADN